MLVFTASVQIYLYHKIEIIDAGYPHIVHIVQIFFRNESETITLMKCSFVSVSSCVWVFKKHHFELYFCCINIFTNESANFNSSEMDPLFNCWVKAKSWFSTRDMRACYTGISREVAEKVGCCRKWSRYEKSQEVQFQLQLSMLTRGNVWKYGLRGYGGRFNAAST